MEPCHVAHWSWDNPNGENVTYRPRKNDPDSGFLTITPQGVIVNMRLWLERIPGCEVPFWMKSAERDYRYRQELKRKRRERNQGQ